MTKTKFIVIPSFFYKIITHTILKTSFSLLMLSL